MEEGDDEEEKVGVVEDDGGESAAFKRVGVSTVSAEMWCGWHTMEFAIHTEHRRQDGKILEWHNPWVLMQEKIIKGSGEEKIKGMLGTGGMLKWYWNQRQRQETPSDNIKR